MNSLAKVGECYSHVCTACARAGWLDPCVSSAAINLAPAEVAGARWLEAETDTERKAIWRGAAIASVFWALACLLWAVTCL